MGHGSMNYQLKTSRLIMIFVNVIIFLIGAKLLGEGIELLITRRFQNLTEFISMNENSNVTWTRMLSDEILYIITIIPGLILVSIGFFGCSGAITQIQCLLFLYSWIIGFVLIFQTIIIIFRFKIKEQLIFTISLLIRDIYKGPLEKNLQSTSALWDLIMYHISCAINGSYIYEISCYKKFVDIFHSIDTILLIIVSFILLIELFALIFVLVIYNRNQMKIISNRMVGLPPPYSLRTRINTGNLYSQI